MCVQFIVCRVLTESVLIPVLAALACVGNAAEAPPPRTQWDWCNDGRGDKQLYMLARDVSSGASSDSDADL
jgi:hypothetical protein